MAENATSVTKMSTVRRTKVCDVVSARSSTNEKKRLPTRLERLGTTARSSQTTANRPRGDTKGNNPCGHTVAPLDARDVLGIDLKAGKQEQKCQTEL